MTDPEARIADLERRLAQTQADLEAARLAGQRLADPTYRFRGALAVEDTHGLIRVMAESFVALLDAHGAPNFLTQELDFKPSGGPRVVVTIQRATGKTPAERYWEVATELAALKGTTPDPLPPQEEPTLPARPKHHCWLDETTGRVSCALCGAEEQAPEGRHEVVIAALEGFQARHAACPERRARAVSVDVLDELRLSSPVAATTEPR